MPLARLIMGPVDGQTGEMTEKKRSHTAVTDEGDVVVIVAGNQVGGRTNDPGLGRPGGFPAVCGSIGIAKEPIS